MDHPHRGDIVSFEGFGPDAFRFLQALDFHQSRDWFAENRAIYEAQLREPLLAFGEEGAARARDAGLAMRFDARKGPFRINRDVRFSKDKSPYNKHVSAVLSADGTKGDYGVLYVHVGLEETFFAAGFWALPKEVLEPFRRHVLTYPDRYRALVEALGGDGLTFGDEGALKRLPRGYDDPGDPVLGAALRLRGFTVSESFPRELVHSRALLDRFGAFAASAKPLLDWGRAILA